MGTRSLVGLILAAMLSSAISEPASGGVHMVAEIQDLRVRAEAPRRAEIWVEGSRVRIDDSWEVAGVTWSTMLYDGDQDVFIGLNQKQRSYVRLCDVQRLRPVG